MLFRNLILPGVIVPALFGGVAFALAAVFRTRLRHATGAGALAVAAGLLSSYVALTGWPRWPPVEATQRIFFVVALAALLTFAFALWRGSTLPWIVRAVFVILLAGLVLESQIRNRWATTESILWIAGLSLVGLLIGWSLRRSLGEEAHVPGRLLAALVRLALIGGTAIALGLSESAILAQLTGAVACAMTVVEIIGLVRRKVAWHAADALPLQLALFGLLLVGYFYAGLEPLPAILLILAYLVLGITTGKSTNLRLAPLLPLAAALAIVIVAFMNQPEDPYADYYAALSSDRASVTAADRPG